MGTVPFFPRQPACKNLMMHRQKNEDLFDDSTMTFGQHLEELRACLFKAIAGLIVGCIIGMIVGGYVVSFIKDPLEAALADYFKDQAVKNATATLDQLAKQGYTLPGDADRIKKVLADRKLTFDVVYLDPVSLSAELKNRAASEVLVLEPPAEAPDAKVRSDELIPVVLYRQISVHVKTLNAQEAFMIYLKASFLVGAIIASPWVFYQIWSFVAAGLYRQEKRYVHLFLPASLGLFLAGVALAFFVVIKPVLKFLFSFNSMTGIEPDPRISEWLGFVLFLPLGFGISFQLPLVMLFFERIGVFTVRSYLTSWKIAVLGIFILALILTPSGDPYSMLLMAGPLTVLYFGGIALCRYLPRRHSEIDAG
jgi:sec-independent protein translocase protein TatC